MLRYEYRQTNNGGASEVDDIVDGDHLQVQHHLLRASDGPRQDQCGTDIAGLSHVKLPSFVARLYLEDIKGTRVTCGGLHLKNVCGNTAARGQVHVSVQDGEGLVSAGGVLS